MDIKSLTAMLALLSVVVGYSGGSAASDYGIGTKEHPKIEHDLEVKDQPKIERKISPQTKKYPRFDCGREEHLNLPLGERFVVLPMGNFFDKETCLEWYVYTDLGHHENPEEGVAANYHLVYDVCHSWLCIGTKGGYECDGRWSVPTRAELATLVVTGKQNPAFRDDFPAKVEPMNCNLAGGNLPDPVKSAIMSQCDVWSSSTNSANDPTELLVQTINMADGSGHVKNASQRQAQAWCVSRRLRP